MRSTTNIYALSAFACASCVFNKASRALALSQGIFSYAKKVLSLIRLLYAYAALICATLVISSRNTPQTPRTLGTTTVQLIVISNIIVSYSTV